MVKQTFDMDSEEWKKLIDVDEWNNFVYYQYKFPQMATNPEQAKKMFFWFKFGKHIQEVKPNSSHN